MNKENKWILSIILAVILGTIIIILSIKGFSQNMDIVSSNLCGEDTDQDIIDYKMEFYRDAYNNGHNRLKVKCNNDLVLSCEYFKTCIEWDEFEICTDKGYEFWCQDTNPMRVTIYDFPVISGIIMTINYPD